MSEKLKLYQPVNLGGKIGFLPKGEVVLGKRKNEVDPVVLGHWLIKAMLNDGTAAIIKEPEKEEQDGAGDENEKPNPPKSGRGKKSKEEPEVKEESASEPAPEDAGDNGTTESPGD